MTRTCIHGLPGCLMPGLHAYHQCYDEATLDASRRACLDEEDEQAAGIAQSLLYVSARIARKVLSQLDERLHPWGEVGEVPAEDGEYYVAHGDEREVHTAYVETVPEGRMVTLDNWGECLLADDELVLEHRFRKRWAPTPPSERALDAALVVGKGDPPLAQDRVFADIAAERTRQREVHGCTDALDNLHRNGELATAAASYALAASDNGSIRAVGRSLWPWSETLWKKAPGRRMLVKATALLVAEIERLDRARGSGA